jgi:hypothetical protein
VRNTYLVGYDICEDKRLRNVFKTMRDFGDQSRRDCLRAWSQERSRAIQGSRRDDGSSGEVTTKSLGPLAAEIVNADVELANGSSTR